MTNRVIRMAVTIKEAAELTNLSVSTIWKFIRMGLTKVYRFGTEILIPAEALEDLLSVTSPQNPTNQAATGGEL